MQMPEPFSLPQQCQEADPDKNASVVPIMPVPEVIVPIAEVQRPDVGPNLVENEVKTAPDPFPPFVIKTVEIVQEDKS